MVDFDRLHSSLIEEEVEVPEIEKKARIRLYKEIKLVRDHSDSTIIFDIRDSKYALIHIQNKSATVLGRVSHDPVSDVLKEMALIAKGEVTIVYARKWLTKIIPPASFFRNWDDFHIAYANQSSYMLKKFNWKTENPVYTIKEKLDRNSVLKQLYTHKERYVPQVTHLREPEATKPSSRGQFRIDDVMA